MNNEQFRKLLLANSAKSPAEGNGTPKTAATPNMGSALGSRQRSSIPMTPRSLSGAPNDFARQLAERNQANRPQKKFRTMTPRGVKLAAGYVDRAKDHEEEEPDDRVERLKALEELVKNEEIDQATFEKLRFEIVGGDLESTHLVKGLDFKLLRRIKEGEDVYEDNKVEAGEESAGEDGVDDEFEQLESRGVEAIGKERAEKKKGQLSTVQLAPGKKRTRDQILAELRATREAAKAQHESALGGRFSKIGGKKMPGSRIERDSKGREVLIIVDEDGHEKRKVRKLQPGAEREAPRSDLLMPDKNVKPLGMEVPEAFKKPEVPKEDSDDDIFGGVGDDYDPLAGMDGSDSEAEEAESKRDAKEQPSKAIVAVDKDGHKMPPPPRPPASRNYFKDSKTGLVSEEASRGPNMSDPAILAAIKKAAALNPIGKGDDDEADSKKAEEAKALEERRRKMLESTNRDDEDLDMGFGTSRFEDEEDFEESKIKLSVWGQGDGDEDQSGKAKRKRGPKKRKGDANNAADVLRVMEERKKS